MKNIKLIKNNIFLKAYILCGLVVLVGKLIFAIVDGDVLIDTLRIFFRSLFFASPVYVESYFTIEFRAVGPLAILLICHFGLYFVKKLEEFDFKPLVVVIPIVGIGLYLLVKLVLKGMMPFSLLEAGLFASILYPIRKFIKIKVPDIVLYIFVLVVQVAGIIYMFME